MLIIFKFFFYESPNVRRPPHRDIAVEHVHSPHQVKLSEL